MKPNEWLNWICASADRNELSQNYDKWAETYEADIASAWKDVPTTAAEMLSRHLSQRLELFDPNVPLLDVGAGTGVMGAALAKLGFTNIIGFDISASMLAQAEQKGVYRSLICCAIADEQLNDLEPVAGAIATGVLAERHGGPEDLQIIQRKIRRGGIFVFTVRKSFLPHLQTVLDQPGLTKLETKLMPIYDDPMYLLAYQIH